MTEELETPTQIETNNEVKEEFYLLSWRQLAEGKLRPMQEIVHGVVPDALKFNMTEMHRQKRLTTCDYDILNLSELLDEKGLEIREK